MLQYSLVVLTRGIFDFLIYVEFGLGYIKEHCIFFFNLNVSFLYTFALIIIIFND